MWHEIAKQHGIRNPIIQYHRNNRNEKIGVLIAGEFRGDICLGWSLCSKKDIMDKQTGIMMACIRAMYNDRYAKKEWNVIPVSMRRTLIPFINRVCTVYKDKPASEFISRLIYGA